MVEDTAPIIHVVDDDEAVRDSLKLLLEIHGMVVKVYRIERRVRTELCAPRRLPDPGPPSSRGQLDRLSCQASKMAQQPSSRPSY